MTRATLFAIVLLLLVPAWADARALAWGKGRTPEPACECVAKKAPPSKRPAIRWGKSKRDAEPKSQEPKRLIKKLF